MRLNAFYLCKSYQEDGSFHDDATGVEHQGFRREWLLNQLWEAGCRDVRIETAHVIEKPVANGATGRFPVFFMAARTRAYTTCIVKRH